MAYSSPKKYEVFISFRGEDTRSNFVSHLRSALDRDNIETYADDEDLEKGDEVWPSLSQAIHDSYVAIVVFSQNYASSKWCLKELVHILKCRKTEGLVVIPVFYEVDPSHIRKHMGSYGEAIARHEKNFGDKGNESIKEWKDALSEAANISGWDSCSRDSKNEAQIIQKIVQDVLEKLDLRCPDELKAKGLVQIDQICGEVKLLLSKNRKKQLLENVKMIGIWGMGGIGKTTIAKALFSQHFPQHDGVCFLANVREESKRRGLISLHDELLSKLLKDEHHRSDVARFTFMTRRLKNKKVLLVLDDVDSSDQLDVLCGECNYAGPDSKIIVTTRDRHLLISAGVDEIYDVRSLSFAKSLELFSLHAFKQRHPQNGYEDLSRRAVDYAGGVPLALKVLGSNLYSRSVQFWDSELSKLLKFPNDRIQSVLQVSYDGLDSVQKKIFLDIAFFFKGEHKNNVIRILDACGFYATSGVQVLVDKALINTSYNGRIQMHDLIQEMGMNLARQGIEDPGNHSRLTYAEEVSDVLENKKGSDAVEGIKLDLSEIDDLQLNADSFNKMNNLRILILHIPFGKKSGNMHYPMAINKLSGKLRYLEWKGCGLKSLPANFSAKVLVEIRMTHSHVTELWPGVKDVVNLERIDLCECKQLKNLPDLSKASKLKWVNISGCENLVAVHPSVLSLDTLIFLKLDGCKKLESVKGVKHLTSLQKISVNGCTSLREFSVSSDSISSLDLSSTGVEILDSSIGRLRYLSCLKVQGLRNLPSELSFLEYLSKLKICNCRLAMDKEKLHVVFGGLTSLKDLTFEDCLNLCELPDNISNLSKLERLRLDGSSLKTLPASIKHLTNLKFLSFANCRKLESLPELPSSVSKLKAMNCTSLVTVSSLGVEMGNGKIFISFENCIRLDNHSLDCIMDDAFFVINNHIYRWLDPKCQKMASCDHDSYRPSRGFLFDRLEKGIACFPGSRVPRQFTYQSRCSSLTINLPSSRFVFRGLIFCAVLSPSWGIKGAKIWCKFYLPDGTKLGHTTFKFKGLNSDHVYMWCNPVRVYNTDGEVTFEFFGTSYDGESDDGELDDGKNYDEESYDGESDEVEVTFKFFVTSDNGESDDGDEESDDGESDVLTIPIKECGVYRPSPNSEDLKKHCWPWELEPQHTAPSIRHLRNINFLNVKDTGLGQFSSSKDLKELRICSCRLAVDKEKLQVVFDRLTSLQYVSFEDCLNLCELPDNISNLSKLMRLTLDGSSVKTLPASIKHLTNLKLLSLANCRKLESLPELPSNITELKADDCKSLVAAAMSFSDRAISRGIFISFKNCIRLDKGSLHRIMENAHFATFGTVCQTIPEQITVRVIFPGSRVPGEFIYRTTTPSLTVDLPSSPSHFGGLILFVTLSPSTAFSELEKPNTSIMYQCYLPDGTKLGHETGFSAFVKFNSDHAYMWCDPDHCRSIVKIYDTRERQVAFEFFVSSFNRTIPIKECGVSVLVKSK